MNETAGRTSSRIDPETAWTIVTDSPLKGMALAREAGTILAWDEGNQLYLFDIRGESLSYSRVPSRIVSGAISDEGGLIALVVEADEPELLLLDADFSVEQQKPAPSDATFLTIDPHGRYLAVGTRHGLLHLLNRYGRPAGRVETVETISHFCFVPDRALAIVAAAFGMMGAVALDAGRGDRLETEILWQERMMSTVGRLAISGDGGIILASCYTLGIQRFDLRGHNEGAYHLGGTVSHAVPDFPGRTIVAATLEGELALMNSGGNVRWRTTLQRPVTAVEMDPLGRYVIYGHATGEIVRMDLFGGGGTAQAAARPARRSAAGRSTSPAVRTSTGGVRQPSWVVPVVEMDQQAETAVLSVLEDPPLIALFTSPHRLELFDAAGEKRGQAPDLTGVGRMLRSAPGWLAAATDRQILLYDLKHNTARRLDVSLVELTQLVVRPDDFGLLLVQERDRIGRLTVKSRWVWKQELRSPVEEVAIGPYGFVGLTTHGGEFLVFDPAGEYTTGFTFDASDPPLLIEAPVDSPPQVAWITLTRRAQILRGHDLRGQVIWERPTPWEGWALYRIHRLAVATAPDGQALACTGSGELAAQSTSSGEANDLFYSDPAGIPLRISRRGVHLICSTLDGRVRWRAVVEQAPGPIACASRGVAVMLGRSLAWFQDESSDPGTS
jgi:hypothetical protein